MTYYKEANLKLSPQGSTIKEVNEALKTASKAGTGKVGFPEYCGVVKDFSLVIKNKADLSKHIKRNDKDVIANDAKSVKDFKVNLKMVVSSKKIFFIKIIV